MGKYNEKQLWIVNEFNQMIASYIGSNVGGEELEEVLREWKLKPPLGRELRNYFIKEAMQDETIQRHIDYMEKNGLEKAEEHLYISSKKVVTERIKSMLKRLKNRDIIKIGKVRVWRGMENYEAGYAPKNVYVHKDRIDKQGKWIPHAEHMNRKL